MSQIIGTAISRTDGPAKVTGTATYGAEHQLPGLVHGYLITAQIAHGRILNIDTEAIERSPGVIAVFTHDNMPRVFTPANDWATAQIYETRLPLADDLVHYAGQIIGLVVADTFERARDAAHSAPVEYQTDAVLMEADKATYEESPPWFGEDFQFQEGAFETGDFAAARAGAATAVEATYTTETELNSPMEPHALVAHWQTNDAVTIYEPTQWVRLSQGTYAQLFGLPTERVRIVSPYVGGAFGAKAFPWPHGILCVAAARELQRPLKVVVSRRQMTANTGHRSQTEQTVRLATDETGQLIALEHTARTCTSPVEVFSEPCTAVTPVMYATPNLRLGQELAVLNVGTPTFMRAPGEAPGMFALESAMDELAWELGLDPVELRLRNETPAHQRRKRPFSAKNFADCLRTGAEQFGWSQRQMPPRSQQRDNLLVGWGMAAATFPGLRGSAEAKVRLLPDETAHVLTSANDMGTGSYTVIAMTAAETLGLPVESIQVEIGDSLMPDGGLAGGSQMTATLAPAVVNACQAVLETANAETAQQAFASLQASGRASYEATGSAAPGEEGTQFAFQSWGAHFCEVTVDEEIARLRITRWVSVMDVGRVVNAKAAASQIRGGIIMGIGSALMEECHFDPASGHPVVYDLATYHCPAHADIPHIEVTFVGEPDLNFNPLGVRGAGEIGIMGVAPAVANAVYHATGKRIRNLPIIPDKLI